MACDKRYGLRRVWVAAESAPNVPATFTANSFLVTTGSTFPAAYREVLELNESLPGRAKYQDLAGAQNELAFDITINMPMLDQLDDFPAVALFFWALGSGPDDPALAGEKFASDGGSGEADCSIAIKNSTTCGRTIQIAGLDRDGLTMEILTGCIVSQAVFNFSRTEQPTIQFSGVAARKLTANAFETTSVLNTGDNAIAAGAIQTSYNRPSYMNDTGLNFTGISLVSSEGYKAQFKKMEPGKINIGAFDTAPAAVNSYHFEIVEPSTLPTPALIAPDSWRPSVMPIDDGLAQTALTVTVESGLSYGDLTIAEPWPTEILSGQAKISGSMAFFMTNATPALINALKLDGSTEQELVYNFGSSSESLIFNNVKLTEIPELDLSSVDEAATLEISFNAYNPRNSFSNPYILAFIVGEY